MKVLSRTLLRLLARAARPHLEAYGLLRVKKIFNSSALEWTPAGERVLVLAPHMDDEVIGCGGTLAHHLARGAEVRIVFLTDGRRGGRSGATAEQAQCLIEERKSEAKRALAELGISAFEFLDGEDGALAPTAALVARLREILERARPEILYLPSFLEEHPDHRAASALLAAAVSSGHHDFRCHAYEVWTTLYPNCLVPIDATLEVKRRALKHYQTQLAEADYLHTALGLNAYRSSALLDSRCRYAEAFMSVPLREYVKLFEAYGQGAPSAGGGGV